MLSEPAADTTICNLREGVSLEIEIEKYSSLTKLLRVTALALHFIKRLKDCQRRQGTLTNTEMNADEQMWIDYIQKKNFFDVYVAISSGMPNNLQKPLGLCIDENGIIQCKSRIDEAGIRESTRRPVMLPKSGRFTHLLIEKVHKQNMHSGVSQTLSQVRYKYWVYHGRGIDQYQRIVWCAIVMNGSI